MSATLYYFTGTGNSLWCARQIAAVVKNGVVVPMEHAGGGRVKVSAGIVGLVFPVHIWGLPRRVIDFVKRLEVDPCGYCFAVAVNGGQVAATLQQLQKLMKTCGQRLSGGFEITLASNYIPWGGPGTEEKINLLIKQAREKIGRMAGIIQHREIHPVEKGPWWQNILFSWFYRMSFPYIPEMDKKFWVDAKCNGCGICAKICPSKNIRLEQDKPVWMHHCEQCLACLQWCPQAAIQCGPKTPLYPRYHHPEIRLKDMPGMNHGDLGQ